MSTLKRTVFFILTALLLTGGFRAQNKSYVILISFDGFRWDYPAKGLSPNLEFIKKSGVHALSLKPCFPSKTFPNHISIVTGLYPQNHGIIANNFLNPVNGKIYKIGDTTAVRDPEWYRGEAIWETARRQGVKTACYFWPGSEINLEYRRPDYYEKYEHARDYNTRIKGVLDWLTLPYSERPRFITLYFDAADTYGHRYGTRSGELDSSIMRLDSLIGRLFDGLRKINLYDSTDVIVVSDHGMTDVSPDRIINAEEILGDIKCTFWDHGPVMYLFPEKNEFERVYNKFKLSENHYKIFKKKEMPDHYHFSESPMIPELILIADPGWSLVTKNDLCRYGGTGSGGDHGYDNSFLDMHGIFFAIGPDFKTGYSTGTIDNIDIYPLLAEILGIYPNRSIDGKLENIEFILKNSRGRN